MLFRPRKLGRATKEGEREQHKQELAKSPKHQG
jgi:hypothetical protein